MWIKIEYEANDEESIIVPEYIAKLLHKTCTVSFGKKSVNTRIIISNSLQFIEDSTFDNPIIVKFSHKLKEKLLIPATQIYRMKIRDNKIIIGPVIAFMLGMKNHIYSPQHMEKYSDRFGIYNKVGGLVFAFSPTSVDWINEIVYGLYYDAQQCKWVYGVFPLPSVIYIRNFHHTPEVIDKLSFITEGRLFNSYRYTKLELFDHVRIDTELAKSLPPTEVSQSYDQLKNFIDKYTKVILKPDNLSRGRGICIIEKCDSFYKVFDYRTENPSEVILEGDHALFTFFDDNNNFFNEYLVQKYLRLAEINNCKFDIRVVMQREDQQNWLCTGIESRVASHNSHLTNISRGGYALPLSEALVIAFDADNNLIKKITNQIDDYCIRFCEHMDKLGQHFAEFGMDIALDEDKKIWLIEANVLPSFKGFKEMDYDNYLAIRYSPLLYALSLTALSEANIGSI